MSWITKSKGARLTAAALLLATLVPFSGAAEAQAPPPGAESLTVSPPLVELDATPGAVMEQKVAIENNSSVDRNVKVSVQNFGAQGESGQADLTDEDGPYSLKSWIKVTPESVNVKSKERKEFTAKITVPATPPPGGRFGALLFEATNTDSVPDANLKVIPRVSSLFLLKVPGDIKESAKIASFTASTTDNPPNDGEDPKSKKIFTGGPVALHTRIQNEGNVQVKPTTKVEIYNIFGSKIATIDAKPGNVLPESVRRFDTTWDNKNLLGYYKAKTTVTYGSNGDVLTSETSFWGAPLGLVLGIIGGALALFLLVWLPRKRLKKAFTALKAG